MLHLKYKCISVRIDDTTHNLICDSTLNCPLGHAGTLKIDCVEEGYI